MLMAIQRYQEKSKNAQNLQSLADLISDLDALRCCLKNPSESWLKEFQSEWATLEEVYAVMLDRGEARLDEVGGRLVEESIGKLLSLIQSQKDEK